MTGAPPDTGVVIDRIESYDLASVASLHARCFDEPWRPELIRRIVFRPGGFGLFARRDGRPVGFVLCRWSGSEGEVLSLGVAPSTRRLGLGRTLMDAAMRAARSNGVSLLYLEVAEDNEPARQLYRVLDFVRVGRRRDYYKRGNGASVDALTLRCQLAVPVAQRDTPL